MMIIFKIVFVVFVGAVVLYGYCRSLEKSSLYYPTQDCEGSPADLGIAYEEVFISTGEKSTVHGWFIPAENAGATLIFCHGNGGNISHRLGKIAFFHTFKVNILIFDYRGYGKSQGVPDEAGLYQDAEAAYEYVGTKLPCLPVIIYGESLGGAVAVDVAGKKNVGGVIMEGAFTRIADMAQQKYPWLPAILLKSRFDVLAKISLVKAPKLHLHSRFDEVVPFALGKQLFDAAAEPKTLVVMSGSHNDGFFISEEQVRKAMEAFFTAVCLPNAEM
jgi:fermentation-respiration switch protein FrsA (DUF1100 family)